MNIHKLEQIVEQNTGALLLKGGNSLFPITQTCFPEHGYDDIDLFWSKFFATQAQFDEGGILTEESRNNILSHLEAIQASARAIALEISCEVAIMPPRVKENAFSDR